MSWVDFEHNGKRRRLAIVRTSSGVWIGWPGRAKFFKPDRASAAEGEALPGKVRAPMTGKVVKVEVRPGERVKEKQVVVVLEAMKMEYRLAAPIEGVVEAVHCKAGELVDLDKTLVSISEDGKK